MGTRLYIRGRAYRVGPGGDPMFSEEKRVEAPRDRRGNPVDTWPIPPSEKIIEFRAGVPYTCPEDGITYRVLKRCDPKDGWAPAGFWRRRWGITFRSIRTFVEKGWLQPGIEEGSPTKRYRCVDEVPIIDYLERQRGKAMRRNHKAWRGR